MEIFTYTTTANYCDVNANNLLSNVGILRIFQEAAALHSNSIGFGPNDTPNTNLTWILLSWKLKVFSRSRWNSNLKINTWANIYENVFSYRDFEMYDDKNNLIAIASSKWVMLDCATNHIAQIPKIVSKEFNTTKEPIFGKRINLKLKEPINILNSLNYTVNRRDIDTNYHVNNLNYLHFATEALPENIYLNSNFNNIEIMYKSEAKLKDTLTLNYFLENQNEHIISIKNNNKLNAIIKMWED